MHRIDGGRYGFTAEEDHNVVTIGGGIESNESDDSGPGEQLA